MSEKGRFYVFDGHCDTAQRLTGDDPVDLGKPLPDGHVDIPRMKRGGVGAQVFACWVDPDSAAADRPAATLGAVEAVRAAAVSSAGEMTPVLASGDLPSIRRSGRIAVLVGVEGGHVLDGSVELIDDLYAAGVRCLTLTWNNTNSLADAAEGERRWKGLSPAGRGAVRKMNRLGMAIDLSHASDETFYDVLEVSSAPVLVSHSNMRALCDIRRNISDAMLLALGSVGGVVGINFFPAFLDEECHAAVFAVWDRYRAERSALAAGYGGDAKRADEEIMDRYLEQVRAIPMPGIEAVAEHMEHAASVAGASHVGLGSDFDGIAAVPPGLEDVSRMQSLAAELLLRGWSEDEVASVMGENLLRFFEDALGRR